MALSAREEQRALLVMLRAYLEWRRHRDYEKWLISERLSDIRRDARRLGVLPPPPPKGYLE